jgi:hypothetical protein
MKWPTYAVRIAERKAWHRWFAWYPVHCGDRTVWMETVWRRIDYLYYDEYQDGVVQGIGWEYSDADAPPLKTIA